MKATKAITGIMAAAMSAAVMATSLTAFADNENYINWTGKSANVHYSVELNALKQSNPSDTSMAADALDDSNSYIYYDSTAQNYKLCIAFVPMDAANYGFSNKTVYVDGMTATDADGNTLDVAFDSTNSVAVVTINTDSNLYNMSSYDGSEYAILANFSTDSEDWFLSHIILPMMSPTAYVTFSIGDAIS